MSSASSFLLAYSYIRICSCSVIRPGEWGLRALSPRRRHVRTGRPLARQFGRDPTEWLGDVLGLRASHGLPVGMGWGN